MPVCTITGTLRNLSALWVGEVRITNGSDRIVLASPDQLHTKETHIVPITTGSFSAALEESASTGIPYRFDFHTGSPASEDPVFSFHAIVPDQPTATFAQLAPIVKRDRATDPGTVARSLSQYSALNKFTRKGLNILFQDDPPRGDIFSESLGSSKLWCRPSDRTYWEKRGDEWVTRKVFSTDWTLSESLILPIEIDPIVKFISPRRIIYEVRGSRSPGINTVLLGQVRLMRSQELSDSQICAARIFNFSSDGVQSFVSDLGSIPVDTFKTPVSQFSGFLIQNQVTLGSLGSFNFARQTIIYEAIA